MIHVTLFKRDDRYLGLHSEGHAGQGEYGFDIVCAGVSALLYSVAETLTEEYDVVVDIDQEGKMDIDIRALDDEHVQTIMKVADYGIKGIQRQYPEFVKLQSKEDRHVTI